MKAPAKASVFGASGFVGRHMIVHLTSSNYDVQPIGRNDVWRDRDLGHAYYCVGLTADFRTRPFETIDAHVSLITEILRSGSFQSLIYLSSTRVYANAASTAEATNLSVQPSDPSDLYNLSKLLGESVCLSSGRPNVRVARLSNVFGDDTQSNNFLSSVVRDAIAGHVSLRTSLASQKDYIWIGDVVAALEAIATRGSSPITNVAYGANTSHNEILAALSQETGCTVDITPGSETTSFPTIDTSHLDALKLPARRSLVPALPDLVSMFRERA